ncbi:MAG: sigma-54 dependent transcriptional regulator [Gammaproteobacteria bacterium]
MTSDVRILIVEDDRALAEFLDEELRASGYVTRSENTVAGAIASLHSWPPTLVVSDLRLPDGEGLAVLAAARSETTPPAFLIITAFGSIAQAVTALKAGADEFLTKPLDMEHFALTIERLVESHRLKTEVKRFRTLIASDDFHGISGRSRPMLRLYDQICQIGPADGPVLVLGESGTGKELVARALHAESARAAGPFVAINCAGIPAELMESEFFGHVAGAFTGARQARAGLFAEAAGGTLLLDEIGEMPLALQAKLLRALQEGTVRPVGSDTEKPIDVRVVAATHQDLHAQALDGEFRPDLFYRLETFSIYVPPLRDRGSDLDLLAQTFLREFGRRAGRGIQEFDDAARAALKRYPLPGKVRELSNAIERAVTFCDGPAVGCEHLPARIAQAASAAPPYAGLPNPAHIDQLPSLAEVQRRYVTHVLATVDGNKRRAAELLGINRRTLYRWLERDDPD